MLNIDFQIVSPEMFDICAKVIRDSFITVANDFNLTKENAPTNPAFTESSKLSEMFDKGIEMFAALKKDVCIGFVAVEKAGNGIYYIEKLSIIPEYRHMGYGKMILDFVVEHVRNDNGQKISIGIINENEVLKKWYQNNGFRESEIKVFKHLPFTVCLMEKKISLV